jgi:hypothetical protein
MDASELEYIWKKQQPIEPSRENITQIAATVIAEDRKFHRRIWWRDLREIGAALIMAIVFGLVGQTWLRWISVASCLFVAGFLVRSRTAPKFTRESPSVVERFQQMISETETQIQLLRSILWWYLLPCLVAIVAMVLDSPPRKFDLSFLLIFGSATGVVFVGCYWLNQRAVRKVLEPRRENLRHALAELCPRT